MATCPNCGYHYPAVPFDLKADMTPFPMILVRSVRLNGFGEVTKRMYCEACETSYEADYDHAGNFIGEFSVVKRASLPARKKAKKK